MNRRRLLQLTGAAFAPMVLTSGCRGNPEALRGIIDPRQIDLPLVIDTHAHVFNATDVQVSKFISTVAANEIDSSMIRLLAELLGSVLQFISWGLAPDADKELRVLGVLELEGEAAETAIARARAEQYEVAKQELARATREALRESGRPESSLAGNLESLQPADQAFASLLQLPDTYEQLHDASLETPFEAFSLGGIRKFLVEMFQYRHVSAVNLFDTYGDSAARLDLATPSLVDYDWWLAGGKETKSPIPAQMLVAERIAVLSGGAVHPFVPFDPFRQALFDDLGLGDYSPLEVVMDAINVRGAMGVKLYPPMGFAVYGNTRFASDPMWAGISRLHEYAKRPEFASRLDAALDKLYGFCAEYDVAVMGHSSRSNMAAKEYEPLLFAESWRRLFEQQYPGGRVTCSFGHFSGFGSNRAPEYWEDFVALLIEESGAGERRRFADLSYFTEMLSNTDDLTARLRGVLFDDDGNLTSIFDQLLYGSDWKMLLMEQGSGNYLRATINVLEQAEIQLEALGARDLKAKALGLNALAYLGLGHGQPTRRRLENFYDRAKVAEPMWMRKADRVSA